MCPHAAIQSKKKEMPANDSTRRETQDQVTDWGLPDSGTGKLFGEVLIDLGYATKDQIEDVLRQPAGANMKLGARLVQAGIIDDVQLAHGLSVHFGVRFTNLSRADDIDPAAAAMVPEHMARRYLLLPINLEGKTLTVAMVSPKNVFAMDTMRAITGLDIEVVAAPEQALRRAIDSSYAFDLETTASEMALADGIETLAQEEAEVDVSQLRTEATDAPVIKYVDSLVARAIRDRASDIHIEPGRGTVSVRMRVDGKLRPTIAPPKVMQNAVISRIKILANMDIAEKRLPLDGRLHVKFHSRAVDLRISTLPTIHGEKVVMRVLDKDSVHMELDSLGFEEDFLAHLKMVLHRPNGIILVTGPTGSGKTTTLYACLNHIREVTKNIISVEDPVEYEIEGVAQVAARTDIGMGFARVLRAILRQDPDVIMVGEMRDLETLEIGVRAALTGHLVLSTLHTNDAVSTIARMVNMGVEPYLISSTLITAIAQRLVRRICPDCKEEQEMSDAIRADIEQRHDMKIPATLWSGRGCSLCNHTGYYGRDAVFEYLYNDKTAQQLIVTQASESELRAYQRKASSGTLLDSSLRKAIHGITTLEEAMQFDVKIDSITD